MLDTKFLPVSVVVSLELISLVMVAEADDSSVDGSKVVASLPLKPQGIDMLCRFIGMALDWEASDVRFRNQKLRRNFDSSSRRRAR